MNKGKEECQRSTTESKECMRTIESKEEWKIIQMRVKRNGRNLQMRARQMAKELE